MKEILTKEDILNDVEKKRMGVSRNRYIFNKLNKRREKIIVDIGCNLKNLLFCQVYVIDRYGNETNKYNPQEICKRHYEDGVLKTYYVTVDDNYVVDATEENERWLLGKIVELAYDL